MELNSVKELKQQYLDTFETEKGKKVLADLEKRCFVKTTTFSKEPLVIAYREGARSVYLTIQSIMSLDLDKLQKMFEESEE